MDKRSFLKNKSKFLLLIGLFMLNSICSAESTTEIKERAYALYATKNFNEAFQLLDGLPASEKNEEVLLVLSNIAEENKNDNLAIQNLNKALNINNTYYKAYYNLGCIFAKKKSYLLASNNFELAIKHNKTFASAYYNLACCQIMQKNYEFAKKNLIKAIELEPKNKDFYYNLALCYKELNKPKQAKKVLEIYDSLS